MPSMDSFPLLRRHDAIHLSEPSSIRPAATFVSTQHREISSLLDQPQRGRVRRPLVPSQPTATATTSVHIRVAENKRLNRPMPTSDLPLPPHEPASIRMDWQDRMTLLLQRITYARSSNEQWQSLCDLEDLLSIEDAIHHTFQHIALDCHADRLLAWQLTCQLQQQLSDDGDITVAASIVPMHREEGNPVTATSDSHSVTRIGLKQPVIMDKILRCLELLWLHSATDRLQQHPVSTHFRQILPWLLHAWQCFPQHNIMVQKIIRILRIFAKLKESRKSSLSPSGHALKSYMIRSGVVPQIRTTIIQWSRPIIRAEATKAATDNKAQQDGTDKSSSLTALYRREGDENGMSLLLLGLIKDLAFRADQPCKEILFHCLGDLLMDRTAALLDRFLPTTTSSEPHTCFPVAPDAVVVELETTTAIFWNWAASDIVGRNMAQLATLWNLLKQLGLLPVKPDTMSVHRNVASIIGIMLALCTNPSVPGSHNEIDESHCPELVLQQSWLVPRLMFVLENEQDADWRRRSMRTIRCLAQCDWGRHFLRKHFPSDQFLNVLIHVMHQKACDNDTRIQVCQTLAALLPSWTGNDWLELGPCIETCLISIIQDANTEPKVLLSASHALHVSIDHSPWKRGTSCYSKVFFEKVLSALQAHRHEPLFHQTLAKLLWRLVQDSMHPATTTAATSPRDKYSPLCGLANPCVMEILTLIVSQIGPDFETSRQAAMDVLQLFLQDECSKKALVEDENLLTALVNVCLITRGSIKDEAKQLILVLVPEL